MFFDDQREDPWCFDGYLDDMFEHRRYFNDKY